MYRTSQFAAFKSGSSVNKLTDFFKFNSVYLYFFADTEKEILKAYGVLGEKRMYGKKYMGVLRTTFVIDENGIIREVIEKVKTKDHTNQILKILNI